MAKKGEYIVRPGTCPGCGTPTGSNSGGESWHNDCFELHQTITNSNCGVHKICIRELHRAEVKRRKAV